MAEVRVFVDDAVLGTLPAVCAKDGVPTAGATRIATSVGDPAGLGVAWLLLLAGPVGWLGLLLIAGSRRAGPETLTVELPMSDAAYERARSARRLRRNAFASGVAATAAATALFLGAGDAAISTMRTLAFVAVLIVVGALVTLLVADHRVRDGEVGIQLDASRRWVVLSRVHPSFAAACQEAGRDRQPR